MEIHIGSKGIGALWCAGLTMSFDKLAYEQICGDGFWFLYQEGRYVAQIHDSEAVKFCEGRYTGKGAKDAKKD